jgi:hypothetical protein
MNILLAASPSFIKDDVLQKRYDELKQRCSNASLHCITQKHFTKMLTKPGHGNLQVHVRDFAAWGGAATTKAYESILDRMNGCIVFWDGESKPEQHLIRWCGEKGIRVDVVRFESLKQELERTKPERKAARKKITVPLSDESKQRYLAAHKKWYERNYATALKDGFYSKPKLPVINSGSRMDFFITNFLVWEGWSATKVNNMGRKVNGAWVASSTKKGTFDLSATIAGKSVKIETKHSSDKPSPDQLKMQERERKAGAIAEFVYSIEEFFELYDKIIGGEIWQLQQRFQQQ